MIAVLVLAPLLLGGLGRGRDTVGFQDRLRAATSIYQDQHAAIADGYRPLGPDAPGMGQHWLSARTLLGTAYDPMRPALLTYTVITGRPTLVGVAYAVPLEQGMAPPTDPAPADAWHFHGGNIEEEALAIVHDQAHVTHAEGPIVAVLHAWVWLENPAGPFVPENWVLPYLRAGLRPPTNPRSAPARALSLSDGGGDFYLAQAARMGAISDQQAVALRALLQHHATRVRAWRDQRARDATLNDGDLNWLGEEWDALWRTAAAILPAELSNRLRGPPNR